MNLYDLNYPFSFNSTICKLVFFAFYAQRNEYDIYLDYLEAIQKHEQKISKNNPQIIDLFIYCLYFVQFFLSFTSKPSILSNIKNSKTKINQKKLYVRIKRFFYMPEDKFEKQKKLFDEGVNPNEIAKIIRNDEIEKLQEISSQNDFNFKQTIVPSPYERCDFINQSYVTLIDYAAFFSSIKCFKYLLMNGANVKNTGKYAVAGGNEEIIHLCEQNHSSFEDAFETAIQFHRNNIFKYLYENKIENINVFSITLLCITYMNYDIFSYMVKEGMEINNEIINVIASLGDFFIIQQFVENNQIPKDLLISSAMSKNLELVKYVLKQKGIDINYNNI